MREVCALLNVEPHVLSYWETEFPLLASRRDEMGRRSYAKRDVAVIERIRELLYEERCAIAQTKERLAREEF
jgi:DNA-binding transcriptional MerR regulator